MSSVAKLINREKDLSKFLAIVYDIKMGEKVSKTFMLKKPVYTKK